MESGPDRIVESLEQLEEGAAPQQRILPADPQATAARLAIRDPFQMGTEQCADGRQYLFRAVEADTADQMCVRWHFLLPA